MSCTYSSRSSTLSHVEWCTSACHSNKGLEGGSCTVKEHTGEKGSMSASEMYNTVRKQHHHERTVMSHSTQGRHQTRRTYMSSTAVAQSLHRCVNHLFEHLAKLQKNKQQNCHTGFLQSSPESTLFIHKEATVPPPRPEGCITRLSSTRHTFVQYL